VLEVIYKCWQEPDEKLSQVTQVAQTAEKVAVTVASTAAETAASYAFGLICSKLLGRSPVLGPIIGVVGGAILFPVFAHITNINIEYRTNGIVDAGGVGSWTSGTCYIIPAITFLVKLI